MPSPSETSIHNINSNTANPDPLRRGSTGALLPLAQLVTCEKRAHLLVSRLEHAIQLALVIVVDDHQAPSDLAVRVRILDMVNHADRRTAAAIAMLRTLSRRGGGRLWHRSSITRLVLRTPFLLHLLYLVEPRIRGPQTLQWSKRSETVRVCCVATAKKSEILVAMRSMRPGRDILRVRKSWQSTGPRVRPGGRASQRARAVAKVCVGQEKNVRTHTFCVADARFAVRPHEGLQLFAEMHVRTYRDNDLVPA